ncbi:MAG: GerMN domain-containing protein, partial [Bacilli bacterium]
ESGSLAYYVPVTRRISVNTSFEQGVFAAMQEGVPGSDDLVSEVNFDAVLRSLEIKGKNIVLDFNENIYTTPDKKQLSTTLLECLALTFANGQRDTTLTVKVNGASEVFNENGKSVTAVMLPTEMNRLIAL